MLPLYMALAGADLLGTPRHGAGILGLARRAA